MVGIEASDPEKARRTLGHGACPADGAAMGVRMLESFQCNISDMPVILQQRSMFTGPVPDNATPTLFAANVDLLSFGKAVPGATEVSLNGIANGQASTHFLICGVFMHLTPPPFNFTVLGGAWTAPAAAGGQPVIPDEWTSVDATAGNSLGLTGAQTLTKAYLDYGNWVQEGFYELARAYNWYWTNGEQTVLLNWPLRHIAKVVPSPQSDTSAQGAISPDRYIAQANAYYRAGGGAALGNGPASSSIFLRRNARRTGYGTLSATVQSTFVPDASFETVQPTYGGQGVQELGCNVEYFRLPSPIVFPRSVSLNMTLQAVSATAQQRVKNAFSMTDGLGGTPPGIIVPDQNVTAANFSGSGASPVFADFSKDTPPVQFNARQPIGTAVFKIGDWWISLGAVGYELNDTQYDMIRANRGDVSTVFGNAGYKIHYWGG